MHKRRFVIQSVTATSATLAPAAGEQTKGDFADAISTIVVNFGTARDATTFDVTNRVILVSIDKG
jgi:hypothetical protein